MYLQLQNRLTYGVASGLRHAAWLSTVLLTFTISHRASADQYTSEVNDDEPVIIKRPPPPSTKPIRSPPSPPAPTRSSTQGTTPQATAWNLRNQAAALLQKKEYARAAPLLEQALALKVLPASETAAIQKILVQIALASGDLKKMQPILEAAIANSSATPDMMIGLASVYIDQKRYTDAIPLLQRGIALSAKPDPAWQRTLAATLLRAGQDSDAIPLLEQAVFKNPKSPREDWQRLIALQLKHGGRERAQATLHIAQRLGYLNTADDRLQLIAPTHQIGAPYAAATLLEGWMQNALIPKSPATQRQLAGLWQQARAFDKAIAVLRSMYTQRKEPTLLNDIAALEMLQGNYSRASEALRTIQAEGKANGNNLIALATAEYQQKNYPAATEAFRAALAFPSTRKTAEEWLRYLAQSTPPAQAPQ